MKIRKIFIVILSAAFVCVFSGCSDWLDLKPESEIILDEYWQTESDVDFVLSACYRGLTEDDNIYRMIVWGELRSDNMVSGSGFPDKRYDMQRILDGDITSVNSYCSWASFYTIINYCNTVLYYAPSVVSRDENFTEADLHRVQAEAYTLRALCYFYLVRAFKEVPWIEDPSIDDTQNFKYEKSTEDVILGHLIDDLKYARQYAVTDFGKVAFNKGRITRNAVDALLADIYLWKQDYSDCVSSCNSILADKTLYLQEADLVYTSVFYIGNSSESIFELQFDDDVQKNNPVFNLYGVSGDMLGEVAFPATLGYDSYEKLAGIHSPFNFKGINNTIEGEDDIRAKDSYYLYGGRYFIFKYAGIQRLEMTTGASNYRFRTTTPNWIIYRLSDVMLMKAEALVQLDGSNNLNEALELVNKTYLRSNENQDSLKISNYPTKTDMADLVLRERQRELLFEGKRWFDLMRVARRENSTGTINDFIDHKASGNLSTLGVPVLDGLYMPILRSELESNPNLVQNSYYEQTSSSSER
jgi:starch-binding outer membrane protein, SusD/RagB family